MPLIIAVTGATGFVGGHAVPCLLASGHTVRVLLRDMAKSIAGTEAVLGDLDNSVALDQLCRGADVVLHMAGAITGLSRHDFFKANADGTANLLAAAERNHVKRVVYLSSLAARQPDISHYAASKHAGELHVENAKSYATLILRPAAVYGEGDVATLPLLKAMMSYLAVVPSAKQNRFSMIHAADLAAICEQAVSSEVTGLREVDDGEGGYTWAMMGEVTRDLFAYPHQLIYLPSMVANFIGGAGDVLARVTGKPQMVSRAKMRELYFSDWVTRGEGWPRHAPIALREGLRRTLLWYMARGALPQRSEIVRGVATTLDENT